MLLSLLTCVLLALNLTAAAPQLASTPPSGLCVFDEGRYFAFGRLVCAYGSRQQLMADDLTKSQPLSTLRALLSDLVDRNITLTQSAVANVSRLHLSPQCSAVLHPPDGDRIRVSIECPGWNSRAIVGGCTLGLFVLLAGTAMWLKRRRTTHS